MKAKLTFMLFIKTIKNKYKQKRAINHLLYYQNRDFFEK